MKKRWGWECPVRDDAITHDQVLLVHLLFADSNLITNDSKPPTTDTTSPAVLFHVAPTSTGHHSIRPAIFFILNFFYVRQQDRGLQDGQEHQMCCCLHIHFTSLHSATTMRCCYTSLWTTSPGPRRISCTPRHSSLTYDRALIHDRGPIFAHCQCRVAGIELDWNTIHG